MVETRASFTHIYAPTPCAMCMHMAHGIRYSSIELQFCIATVYSCSSKLQHTSLAHRGRISTHRIRIQHFNHGINISRWQPGYMNRYKLIGGINVYTLHYQVIDDTTSGRPAGWAIHVPQLLFNILKSCITHTVTLNPALEL
eukprot:jgi/Botrbrau1/2108/Bobra.0093s0015.1